MNNLHMVNTLDGLLNFLYIASPTKIFSGHMFQIFFPLSPIKLSIVIIFGFSDDEIWFMLHEISRVDDRTNIYSSGNQRFIFADEFIPAGCCNLNSSDQEMMASSHQYLGLFFQLHQPEKEI